MYQSGTGAKKGGKEGTLGKGREAGRPKQVKGGCSAAVEAEEEEEGAQGGGGLADAQAVRTNSQRYLPFLFWPQPPREQRPLSPSSGKDTDRRVSPVHQGTRRQEPRISVTFSPPQPGRAEGHNTADATAQRPRFRPAATCKAAAVCPGIRGTEASQLRSKC